MTQASRASDMKQGACVPTPSRYRSCSRTLRPCLLVGISLSASCTQHAPKTACCPTMPFQPGARRRVLVCPRPGAAREGTTLQHSLNTAIHWASSIPRHSRPHPLQCRPRLPFLVPLRLLLLAPFFAKPPRDSPLVLDLLLARLLLLHLLLLLVCRCCMAEILRRQCLGVRTVKRRRVCKRRLSMHTKPLSKSMYASRADAATLACGMGCWNCA